MADVPTRLGRRITATLDAQTPGVRTTRFCRPRTSPPLIPDGWRALTTGTERGRCQRRVVSRGPLLTGIPPCNLPSAPTPSRPPPPGPRLVTIAKRPLRRAGCAKHTVYPNSC